MKNKFTETRGSVSSEKSIKVHTSKGDFDIGKHTSDRMTMREITQGQLTTTIEHGNEFQYFHEGVWKTGFYDHETKIFVGTANGKTTTVIKDVDIQYIENLKRTKPN